jgi:hypothetical protein
MRSKRDLVHAGVAERIILLKVVLKNWTVGVDWFNVTEDKDPVEGVHVP